MKLPNYVSGEWKEGTGAGEPLVDPVTGEELARISSQGIDVGGALEYARSNGGPTLQKLTYRERADLLGKIADVLTANRDEYFRICLLNQGANQADASFDVDGAIYTIKYYAKIGRALAEQKILKEGAEIPLSKTNVFSGQHFLMPAKGAAVFINAFNFPAWGFCEDVYKRQSTVSTLRPSHSSAKTRHESTALPSSRTAQAPHSPNSQPCFVPVCPMSSRKTSSSVL